MNSQSVSPGTAMLVVSISTGSLAIGQPAGSITTLFLAIARASLFPVKLLKREPGKFLVPRDITGMS